MTDKGEIDFTGERFIPSKIGDIALEHLHRYMLASKVVAGKDVLDIACGEGYGSSMLATQAGSVTGVDIDEETIVHAQNCYSAQNLRYVTGSCEAIPLNDHSVDVVVSFETIEHHDKHREMLHEIKRVLREDGILIISSPDKHTYSEVPRRVNPFHVKELYEREFKELISYYFKNCTYLGQSVVYGSSILAEFAATPLISFQYREGEIQEVPPVAGPVYWIAVASDQTLPAFPGSFLRASVDQSDTVVNIHNQLNERDWHIGKLNEEISELRAVLERRDNDIVFLNDEIRRLNTRGSLYSKIKGLLFHRMDEGDEGGRNPK